MKDKIEVLIDTTQAISNDYQAIRRDLAEIKQLLKHPAYVVNMGYEDKETANSLIKKITGRSFKPGEIIRLSHREFALYKRMLPCPPRNP